MPQRLRSTRKPNRNGATTVEFAIILPIVLFTFFGLWEYARLEMIRQAAATACYDAARRGTLPGASSPAMDTAAQRILDIYMVDGATVTTSVTAEESVCEVSVPINQNTWMALYVLPNRNIESECTFNRELFLIQ